MLNLISDTSKFGLIKDPIDVYVRRIEDKINYYLRKHKKDSLISDIIYQSTHVTGSGPGILYGLPKVHKPDFSTNFQMRPIFAAYNCPSYKLAKFLIPTVNSAIDDT